MMNANRTDCRSAREVELRNIIMKLVNTIKLLQLRIECLEKEVAILKRGPTVYGQVLNVQDAENLNLDDFAKHYPI